MTGSGAVEDLIAHGVIRTASDEHNLELTDKFRRSVEETMSNLDESSVGRPEIGIADFDERFVTIGEVLGDTNVRIFAIYRCLLEYVAPDEPEEILQTLLIVDQLFAGEPRAHGAPEAFVPIRGDELKALIRIYDSCVVYCWLDDCNPCDAIKADFDALFDGPIDDLAMFAVYGPDWAILLQEEFDVVGGPVILFIEAGSIQTRFIGAYPRTTLEKEVQKLRDAPAGTSQ